MEDDEDAAVRRDGGELAAGERLLHPGVELPVDRPGVLRREGGEHPRESVLGPPDAVDVEDDRGPRRVRQGEVRRVGGRGRAGRQGEDRGGREQSDGTGHGAPRSGSAIGDGIDGHDTARSAECGVGNAE